MDEIKPILLRQLADGESIWFGCDCMNMMDRQKGIMADGLYAYDEMFDVNSTMSKAELLDFCASGPNHNMVITAAKRNPDGSYCWKVENSWGTEVGKHGFYIMDDAYLHRYAHEFIVHKKYLSKEQLAELAQEPLVLPYNDPLGM